MKTLILAASVAVTVIPTSRAASQDLPPIEIEAGVTTFRLTGQINLGVLFHDDGFEDETYGLVDNDNSSTRLAFEFESEVNEAVTVGGTFEFEYQPYASNVVNLENRDDPDYDLTDENIRKLELFFESDTLGTLSLGQGNMASDGTAQADLSGTTVVANSDIEDTAGGQLLRFSDGTLSEVSLGDDFDNLDGLSRLTRVRYDTPGLLDDRLTLSASYGQDVIGDDDANQYDLAATFEAETDAFTVEAAAAIARPGENTTRLSASASVLHGPTGLSATIAGARQDEDNVEGRYGYVKLGYEVDRLAIGSTAVSIDYYNSADLATEGSAASSFGLAVVQNVDRINTELFATVRSHEYDDDAGDYEDSTAILIGARFSF